MTLPYERRNAIKWAREFLYSLLRRDVTPRVPMRIREQARSVLKHYPSDFDMDRAGENFDDIFGKEEIKKGKKK